MTSPPAADQPKAPPFRRPREHSADAFGAILIAEGEGMGPMAGWREQLVAAGVPTRTLVGFPDADSSTGLERFDCSEIRIATADGHRGHRGSVVELLAALLAGDDAGSAVVYAAGPAAVVRAAEQLCRSAGVAFEGFATG